jgi:hypothetical protein
MRKLESFAGFGKDKMNKRNKNEKESNGYIEQLDDDFDITPKQKSALLRRTSYSKSRYNAKKQQPIVMPHFSFDDQSMQASKPSATVTPSTGKATKKNKLNTICRHCHQPSQMCDDEVYGPYCVKYVLTYYSEHTNVMNDYMVQLQFNKSFGHAKAFGLYTQHNKVERTYNAEDKPPLCVLDVSYIKCVKMVNWERDVEQM